MERISKRYQETGDVHDRPRLGRLRKTTARDDSLLVRLSKARPMSTASQLQEEWTPATPVSSRNVCQILVRNGLYGCIAAQKPVLSKRQLRNRFACTKSDFSTGSSSLPYLRFNYKVSQGEEDQGPSGMASTVSRYEYY